MNKILLLAFVIAACQALGAINYEDYQLIFKEDFNKTKEELLSSGNWTTNYPWYDGETVSCIENIRIGCRSGFGCRKNIIDVQKQENLHIENGQLHLNLVQNDDWKRKDVAGKECYYIYEGAMIRSTFREYLPQDKGAAAYAASKQWAMDSAEHFKGFLYGIFEIDCILPNNSAYYPAFWLFASRGSFPEIDIFEFDHVNDKEYTFYNNVHWQNKDKEKQQNWHKVKNESVLEGMHTWTVDWNEDSITFYLDGELIRTFTELPKDKSSWRKVDIILSLKATFKGKRSAYFKRNPRKFDSGEAFIIDEVRVYKPKATI